MREQKEERVEREMGKGRRRGASCFNTLIMLTDHVETCDGLGFGYMCRWCDGLGGMGRDWKGLERMDRMGCTLNGGMGGMVYMGWDNN